MKIDVNSIPQSATRRVWSVTDFCKRYRLDKAEDKRLRKLLGEYATQTELLMNAKRPPVFR